MTNKELTVVDLFCGAGGLSKGFMDAGYEVVLGIDHDDNALKTFEANHGNAKALKVDLFDLNNVNKIVEEFNKTHQTLDVLVGGPPCQGFSMAGKRQVDDKRNTLYLAMVELAKKMKPRVVLIENVPGILSMNEGKVKEKIFNDFEELGYKMNVKLLYAPEYGIPQIRKRVFFVGFLDHRVNFEYPEKLIEDEKDFINCEQAVSDLPAQEGIVGENEQDYLNAPLSDYQKEMRKNATKLYNHISAVPSEKTLKFLKMIPEGKNFRSLPEEYQHIYKYAQSLTRFHSKKPARTIDTGHHVHFHYKYNRIPSVRECARFQSFPDDFVFLGPKTSQYRQVGNAVPPKLGYVLGEQIKKYLTEN